MTGRVSEMACPAEIAVQAGGRARRWSEAEQSRAEQSRAEQEAVQMAGCALSRQQGDG